MQFWLENIDFAYTLYNLDFTIFIAMVRGTYFTNIFWVHNKKIL